MTFSAYMPTINDILVGTKYVLNGVNNSNYKMFADAYDDSVTNSSCINDITNFVVGEGLYFADGKSTSAIISKNDLRLFVLEYEKQGQSALQVIWSGGVPVKMEYVPIMSTGLNVDCQMRVNGYWYCYDWCKQWKFRPQFFEKFSKENPENKTQMLIIKRPSDAPLFSFPHWFAALRWAQDEGLMAQHSYNDVATGFSGQKIINWVGGSGLTDAEKDALADKLAEKFSGIKGKRTVVSVNNRPENAVVVDNIDPPNVNATYVNYTEEAERKILIANSYPAILLAGSKTGFSSNADEIAVAQKSVYRRKIKPDREFIISELLPVFKAINKDAEIEFKDFETVTLDKNE